MRNIKENKKREIKREKRGKSVGKSLNKVHAHTSLLRDPCAVTSDAMMKISVIYSEAYNIFYQLNIDLTCPLGK